jgi:hypothetical protein
MRIFVDADIWSTSSDGCLTQTDRRKISNAHRSSTASSLHLNTTSLFSRFLSRESLAERSYQHLSLKARSMAPPNLEKYENSPRGRFANRKKPRSTFAERRRAEREREHVPQNASTLKELKFCPWHSETLRGKNLDCPDCETGFLERRVVHVPLGRHACIVDSRPYAAYWRKRLYIRTVSPFHANVTFCSEPHVGFAVFQAVFAMLAVHLASYETDAREVHDRVLQTTRAVEDFCQFGGVDESKGKRSCKLLPTGEILMIVPPVYVSHIASHHDQGSKVSIVFAGTINWAEHAEEPAQGRWHVEARVRDMAWHMKHDLGVEVSSNLLTQSEQILRGQYQSDAAFLSAQKLIMEDEEYMVAPPKPQPLELRVPDVIIEEECNEYMKEQYQRAAARKAFLQGKTDLSLGTL